MWGRFEGDELVAGCHLGANLVPGAVHARRRRRLRRRARCAGAAPSARSSARSDVVAALWEAVEPRWATPARDPAAPAAPRDRPASRRSRPTPDVRRHHPAATSTCSTPRAWRCTPRRSASRPENDAGGGDLYRARVQQLIGRGWSMASFDDAGRGLQGRGRLRDAVRRPGAGRVGPPRPPGRGPLGRAAWPPWSPTSSARAWRRWSRSTSTSGTPPARAAYARVGFEQTATFATLMF